MRLLILFLISYIPLFSQEENLVPNPSFESVNNDDFCGTVSTQSIIEKSYAYTYWSKIDDWTLPQSSFPYIKSAATADIICKSYEPQNIRSGNYSVRTLVQGGYDKETNWKEYVVVKLKKPLTTNNYYYYEFYYKEEKAGLIAPDKIGAIIFDSRPNQSAGIYETSEINGSSNHISMMYSKFNNTQNNVWVRGSGYYNSGNAKNLQWATFGGWQYGKHEQDNIYWDDIKIIDVGRDACPEKWLIDNTIFNQGYERFQASNQIIIGNGVDPDGFHGDVIIKSGSELSAQAPNIITLTPGFVVEDGAIFTATLAPCEAAPCDNPSFKNFDPAPCGTPVVLDVFDSPKDSWKIKWSPAQYVNDANIAEPTFIPPPGKGTINMKIEVTNLCGQYYAQNYSISYNDNPSLSADLTLSNIQMNPYVLSFDAIGSDAYINTSVSIHGAGSPYDETFLMKPSQTLHWNSIDKANSLLYACDRYNVYINSANLCSGKISSQKIIWDRRTSFSFVAMTDYLNTNSPTNNKLYAYSSGADFYETKIFNKWGDQIEYETGRILANPSPVFHAKGNYADGTYYYVVKLSSCDHFYNDTKGGYFTWYNSSPSSSPAPENEITTTNSHINLPFSKTEQSFQVDIFPNPTNDNLNVKISGGNGKQIRLVLYNSIGEETFSKNIASDGIYNFDLSPYNSGVYYLKMNRDDEECKVINIVKL